MKSFSESMRARIASGHAPSEAMRATWADVRRGLVSPPPRRAAGRVAQVVRHAMRRSFGNPQFKSYDDARREALKKARAVNRDVGIWAVKDYEGRGFNIALLPAEGKRFGHELRAEVVKPTDPNPPVSRRKAREILHHGEVGGRRLTTRQQGLFGAIASGARLRKYPNPTRTVDMLEEGQKVVRHVFYGKTAKDAAAVERAHVAADKSLSAAIHHRPYRGVKITTRRRNPVEIMAGSGITSLAKAAPIAGRKILAGFTTNPPLTPIYGRVLTITAQKTAGRMAGKSFIHKFGAAAKAYGLPNGDVLLTTRRL